MEQQHRSEADRVELLPIPPRPLWMKQNPAASRPTWIRTALVAALSSLFTAFGLWLALPKWKPTGDGRTIVNVWTGELRLTSTGESVEKARERMETESARQVAQADAAWRASLNAQEEARQQVEAKAVRVRAHNSAIYQSVKQFVDAHPEIEADLVTISSSGGWHYVTGPFRKNKMLTRWDIEHLLDFLGGAIKHEKNRNDPSLRRAIDDLKKWDYSFTPDI